MRNPALKRSQARSRIEVRGLSVELVRKRIRNLNLSVRGADGQVRVSAPLRVSDAEIRRFVESKRDWIRRQQAKLASLPAAPVYRYETGEQHAFLGRNYCLQVEAHSHRPAGVVLNGDDVLHLSVSDTHGREQRRALLEQWYRQQLALRIPPLIRAYEPDMGVHVDEWRIRRMKTRWGSCNISRRRIWINLELARLPLECLEYIVVHEMTHLLERRHNARFYALMDRFMPHWQEPCDILRAQVMG